MSGLNFSPFVVVVFNNKNKKKSTTKEVLVKVKLSAIVNLLHKIQYCGLGNIALPAGQYIRHLIQPNIVKLAAMPFLVP